MKLKIKWGRNSVEYESESGRKKVISFSDEIIILLIKIASIIAIYNFLFL